VKRPGSVSIPAFFFGALAAPSQCRKLFVKKEDHGVRQLAAAFRISEISKGGSKLPHS
jgi:hypothetical protein